MGGKAESARWREVAITARTLDRIRHEVLRVGPDGCCFCRDCETAGSFCVDDDE